MSTLKQKNEQEKVINLAYNSYSKSMNSYAFYKVSNRELGQDLVQATFVKTWRYLVRRGKINMIKSFLYHILNQQIIDEYRKHKTSSLEVLMQKGFEPNYDDTERSYTILDGKSALLLVKYLPAKYERIIRLRYGQDLSLKEIALLTGQSRNAVAVQSHRALAKLRKLYNR